MNFQTYNTAHLLVNCLVVSTCVTCFFHDHFQMFGNGIWPNDGSMASVWRKSVGHGQAWAFTKKPPKPLPMKQVVGKSPHRFQKGLEHLRAAKKCLSPFGFNELDKGKGVKWKAGTAMDTQGLHRSQMDKHGWVWNSEQIEVFFHVFSTFCWFRMVFHFYYSIPKIAWPVGSEKLMRDATSRSSMISQGNFSAPYRSFPDLVWSCQVCNGLRHLRHEDSTRGPTRSSAAISDLRRWPAWRISVGIKKPVVAPSPKWSWVVRPESEDLQKLGVR